MYTDQISILFFCCAPTREGPRRARLARAAELRRHATGGPSLGGASVGWGRSAEAVASTSMDENITVTVKLRLLSPASAARAWRDLYVPIKLNLNLYEVLFKLLLLLLRGLRQRLWFRLLRLRLRLKLLPLLPSTYCSSSLPPIPPTPPRSPPQLDSSIAACKSCSNTL